MNRFAIDLFSRIQRVRLRAHSVQHPCVNMVRHCAPAVNSCFGACSPPTRLFEPPCDTCASSMHPLRPFRTASHCVVAYAFDTPCCLRYDPGYSRNSPYRSNASVSAPRASCSLPLVRPRPCAYSPIRQSARRLQIPCRAASGSPFSRRCPPAQLPRPPPLRRRHRCSRVRASADSQFPSTIATRDPSPLQPVILPPRPRSLLTAIPAVDTL